MYVDLCSLVAITSTHMENQPRLWTKNKTSKVSHERKRNEAVEIFKVSPQIINE